MKRTHLSTGSSSLYRAYWQHRKREKHTTLCGSICDFTKATTDRARVTCLNCRKQMLPDEFADQVLLGTNGNVTVTD